MCYNTWGKVSGDCIFPDAEVMYQLDKEKGNKVIFLMQCRNGKGEDYGIYIRCTGKTDDPGGRPENVSGRFRGGE